MKVVSLVDNVSRCGSCGAEHGLSLYVELDCGARILFDMGQGNLFADNAVSLGIDLSEIDLAVVSHGHYDHAGGLATFLKLNSKAPVYIRESAFENHYSLKDSGMKSIGVDRPSDVGRLVFCRDIEYLPYGIILFSNPPSDFPEPPGNRFLFGSDSRTPDSFSHEQSMLITGCVSTHVPNDPSCPSHSAACASSLGAACPPHSVLFAGCAQCGIVNILSRAQSLAPDPVTAVFSGMHIKSLYEVRSASPSSPANTISYCGTGTIHADCLGTLEVPTDSCSGLGADQYPLNLAATLLSFEGVHYYTMHCTGEAGFSHLARLMPGRISYLSCGESVIL